MRFFGKKRQEEYSREEEKPEKPSLSKWRSLRRFFSAGRVDRLSGKWNSTPLPIDHVIDRQHRTIVARSKEECFNSCYARAFLRMCKQNIVGHQGVVLKSMATLKNGKPNKALRKAIEDAWLDWSKAEHCDVAQKLTWRLIQMQVVAAVARDGEAFVLFVGGKRAGKYGLSLQLIDSQRIPVDMKDDRLSGGRFIRQGVEFDQYGKVLAYYITSTDYVDSDYVANGKRYQRISADRMLHLFDPEAIDQKRGIPWTATGLWRIHFLNTFEEASLSNANFSSKVNGFISWKEGYGREREEDEDLYIDVDDAVLAELPAGAEYMGTGHTYASSEFAPFNKHMLRGAASGWGVPYNTLGNDLENVNFSSIRQGELDAREMWKDRQAWFIESFCQKVFEMWLMPAFLNGMIDKVQLQDLDAAKPVRWQPRRWSWIDPKSEIASHKEAHALKIESLSQIIRDSGKDPQEVWEEIEAENEILEKRGITTKKVAEESNESEESEKD